MVFIPHYCISKEASFFFLGAEFPLRSPCEHLQKHFTLLQPQQLLTRLMSMVSFSLSCLPPSFSTYIIMFFGDGNLFLLDL